jgi:hypothetical protein
MLQISAVENLFSTIQSGKSRVSEGRAEFVTLMLGRAV